MILYGIESTCPFDSAAGTGGPGAAGLVKGCKFVSSRGRVLGVSVVFGSTLGARA